MRRAKVNYLDKEDMMGHKVGLEQHYERYQEEDFERFSEYQKAIPFLTISEEEKLKAENLTLKEEKSEIDKLKMEVMDNKETIKEFKKLIHQIKTGEVIPRIYHPDPTIIQGTGFIAKNYFKRIKNPTKK